jgi:hypothetical protein
MIATTGWIALTIIAIILVLAAIGLASLLRRR